MTNNHNEPSRSILGLSPDEIAGLSVEELVGNQTAIKMLVHYYKQLDNENISLKNDLNTLNTYVKAYDLVKSNSATGAILLALSSIFTGIGVNLLNGSNFSSGVLVLVSGVIMAFAGIYFSFFKERN